jgi:hypothetical protein
VSSSFHYAYHANMHILCLLDFMTNLDHESVVYFRWVNCNIYRAQVGYELHLREELVLLSHILQASGFKLSKTLARSNFFCHFANRKRVWRAKEKESIFSSAKEEEERVFLCHHHFIVEWGLIPLNCGRICRYGKQFPPFFGFF